MVQLTSIDSGVTCSGAAGSWVNVQHPSAPIWRQMKNCGQKFNICYKNKIIQIQAYRRSNNNNMKTQSHVSVANFVVQAAV